MESLVPRLIVVPTDFSAPAGHALRYASALAERFDAHLLVMYADTFVPPFDFTTSGAITGGPSLESLIENANEELRQHAATNISAGVPYDLRVLIGLPIESITDTIQNSGANLLVMGTHGRSGIRRLLLGSVTEAAMRISPVPVITVNSSASASAEVSTILCPVNFTPACSAALRQAAALGGHHTPVFLFRGLESRDVQPGISELIKLYEWAPPELAGRCALRTAEQPGQVEAILELALSTATDLIALDVGTHRSAADTLRGTIAERIVQQSRCPVLTVNAIAAAAFSDSARAREALAAV